MVGLRQCERGEYGRRFVYRDSRLEIGPELRGNTAHPVLALS